MKDLEPHDKSGSAVTLRPANPEGKGLNGFLLDWYGTEPRGVVIKPQRQVLAEYFTSMLVLSAKFKYRPAVGVPNYLYLVNDEWQLSLIAPEEWSADRRRAFVGKCILQRDMTWTIIPSKQLGENGTVADAVSRFFDGFLEALDTDLALEEILPFYVRRMPYYQRLHASALSRSIRAAITLGDQTGARARDWKLALPSLSNVLLARKA